MRALARLREKAFAWWQASGEYFRLVGLPGRGGPEKIVGIGTPITVDRRDLRGKQLSRLLERSRVIVLAFRAGLTKIFSRNRAPRGGAQLRQAFVDSSYGSSLAPSPTGRAQREEGTGFAWRVLAGPGKSQGLVDEWAPSAAPRAAD